VYYAKSIHLIFRERDNQPDKKLGAFKSYTSKILQKEIQLKLEESRKEWILWIIQKAETKASNVKNAMFWQHHNKPIGLWSQEVIAQKVDYIHNNPVEAGFVTLDV
jgi:REP element-mobilizing transposase RayT